MIEPPVAWRRMTADDLPEIVALERELFSDPWPEAMFLADIEEEEAACAVVGSDGKTVVCYGIGWYVGDEFHIANMAVRPSRQGRGLGGVLLDEMLVDARRRGCLFATLEVRMSNEPAIRLYRSRAFREVAVRTAYYVDNGEDALIMLSDLSPSGEDSGGLVSKE
ncbi:MAG: ribosomal protein S18-alanine N-acetyltransferase [Candidatus Eisenbacteria bacterium]